MWHNDLDAKRMDDRHCGMESTTKKSDNQENDVTVFSSTLIANRGEKWIFDDIWTSVAMWVRKSDTIAANRNHLRHNFFCKQTQLIIN